MTHLGKLIRPQQLHFSLANILKQVGDVGERVDLVQLAAFGERIPDRGGMASPLRADKQEVFSPKGNRPHAALGGVVVHFEKALLGIPAQRVPVLEGVDDGCPQCTPGQYGIDLPVQPGLEGLQHRQGSVDTLRPPIRVIDVPDIAFDPEEAIDVAEGVVGASLAGQRGDLNKFAAGMGPAGDFDRLATRGGRVEQPVIPREGVCLHVACVIYQATQRHLLTSCQRKFVGNQR